MMPDTPIADAAVPEGLDPFTTEKAEQGFGLQDGYPANLLFRAEALAREDIAADPSEIVTPEDIAQAEVYIAQDEAAAEEEADATPSMDWTRDVLLGYATDRGIDVPAGATKQDILDLIAATPAPANP
jgi:hypothetical protein